MSRLDLVIFGATGFTGKHAAQETVRISKSTPLTWGVAGRSQKKLEDVIENVSKKTGENLSSVKIIIANVNDEQSLKAMTAQAKVLVNCCGPFRLYGEQVVKACIDTKTHYVDVTGEPQFMETVQLAYDKAARDAGVYIVSACGFDSIPNDMGVIFLEQNFGGTLNSVESYLGTHLAPEYRDAAKHGVIHYGTWESLVHSLAHSSELAPLRKKLYPERMPSFKPKLQNRRVIHKHDKNWCLPFPGADASIVYRTQRYFYDSEKKRPVQFKPYVNFNSFCSSLLAILGGIFLYAMTRTGFTRRILLNHPRICSFGMVTHEGPKEEVMNNTKFTFELHGSGWDESVKDIESTAPNKKVVAKVCGVNPGYGATVTALMFSAITVLKESDKMPSSGGVLTTGAAFRKTDLINNLNKNNLTFEIIKNE